MKDGHTPHPHPHTQVVDSKFQPGIAGLSQPQGLIAFYINAGLSMGKPYVAKGKPNNKQ